MYSKNLFIFFIFLSGFILNVISVLDFDIYYSPLTSFDAFSLLPVTGVKARNYKYNFILHEYLCSRDQDLLRRFIVPHGKIIKSSFLKQHCILFESVQCSNDVMFASLLLDFSPNIFVLDRSFYSVRQGGPSLTSSRKSRSALIRLSVLYLLLTHLVNL